MPESLDILKLRVLLSFLREDESMQRVTKLAGMLGEGKQKISRLMMTMEKEGLIDRSDTRAPKLTEEGRKKAEYYEERESVILNHLLYEGQDLDSAEFDACVMALYYSDKGMRIVRDSEQRYRAKYELRKQRTFDGDTLCRHLKDGEYRFPFLVYREHVRGGSNLSMANEGFAHPCILKVKNSVGIVCIEAVNVTANSRMNGQAMSGKVRTVQYLNGNGTFQSAEQDLSLIHI